MLGLDTCCLLCEFPSRIHELNSQIPEFRNALICFLLRHFAREDVPNLSYVDDTH